jgi:hypothetical protein
VLRSLEFTHDCAGAGRRGLVRMRFGGDIVPVILKASMNLKMYWGASYVGDEPILSESDEGGVTAAVDGFGGGVGLERLADTSRRKVSKSSVVGLLPAKEKTLPKSPHFFFEFSSGPTSEASRAPTVFLILSIWETVFAKWSKPMAAPP